MDHLAMQIEFINGVTVVCFSLDNAERSGQNGHPASLRLPAICETVIEILKQVGPNTVIMFSESCRASAGVSWFQMRRMIEKRTGLVHLGAGPNNQSRMAFGVSAFCTESCTELIKDILPRHIMTEGYGSVALGIEFVGGEIMWGVHFPIDFRGKGKDNMQYKAMVGLVDVMRSHEGSVVAVGNFSAVPGNPSESMKEAIPDDMQFKSAGHPTFYAGYFDTIHEEKGNWVEYKA